MACSKPKTDHLSDEMRIVLVGKTGSGKSATANTIIGREEFESAPFATSVTERCQTCSLKRFDDYLQIVDTPGFHDTTISKEELSKRIVECATQLIPGITAILFVVRIGRFTKEDDECIRMFINTFGEESKQFVIAVFTGADDLSSKYTIQAYIQSSQAPLKKFLSEIKNRWIVVNNKATPEQKETFFKKLLHTIRQMQRNNGSKNYTCKMMKEAEAKMKQIEAKKLKKIKDKKAKEDQALIAKAVAPLKAEVDKLRDEKKTMSKGFEENNAKFEKLQAEYSAKVEFLEEEINKKHSFEARNQARAEVSGAIRGATVAGSALIGAGAGGLIGLTGGPVGYLVGALVGGLWGAITSFISSETD